MGTLPRPLLSKLALLSLLFSQTVYGQVDLTAANRRPPIPGLPDWSRVGFEQGTRALPTDADVGRIITAAELASSFGLIPDDGQDDTNALQNAISSAGGSDGAYTLIQLPAGVINLSHTVYVDANYVIIRGVSNDPDTGTRLVFSPDDNTKYDVLSKDGTQWDLDGMSFSWSYDDPTNPDCGSAKCKITGSATSGWIWPGRSIFRIGTRDIAQKFQTPYDMAPANRKDFFMGSVNFHWSIDQGKTKGFLASQSNSRAGVMGSNRVYVNGSTGFHAGEGVWIGSPAKYNDYVAWGVDQNEHSSYFVNQYIFQDWFQSTGTGTDDIGDYVDLDHPLRFDVYANSIADGSAVMDDSVSYAKVMPIANAVNHVGIENLYMTQPMAGFDPADAVHNYGNLAPESAMHGIVFRFAEHAWVRNVRTFMTGSHPIATEDARHIQIQDNYFDGAWNKGAGGNGYLRGSRVWESIYFNNTLRNLRHITMQWCSMGNVVIMNNITNDMNLHGGYEGFNLFELNYASVAYEHRAGSCTANCGGEGGSTEGGTWWPIYWSTGDKASKWSGATGPQNVFYRNYMLKAPSPGADQQEYRPYFARDGSLSDIIWQFGWDRDTANGDHYQHLTEGPLVGPGLLLDWQGHEQEDFSSGSNFGVNAKRTDKYTSLFLRDVSDASGVPSFSSIAGFAYCRGKVTPKVVGYYLASSASNSCMKTSPGSIDILSYTHILFAYAVMGTDGTVSLSSDQSATITDINGLKTGNDIKVYLAVGGWGLGTDPTPLQKAAVNTGGARTKMANSLASLCSQYSFDGVDIEWATGVTAAQFTTIATTVKTALGAKGVSVSVPQDFWSLSGVNKVTESLRATVDWISLLTHTAASGTLTYPHSVESITNVVQTAQRAGMFPDLLLMPVPFYGRTYKLATADDCAGEGCAITGPGLTSQCIASGAIGQNTFPYYALDSVIDGGNYDTDLFDDMIYDPTESYGIMTMSDGSVAIFETPLSVTSKIGSSFDLCMGGVAVFSIDQDTITNDLTTAMWEVGGLTPPAGDIAAAVTGSTALTGDGFVDEGFWDDATSALANQYPWLTPLSAYRVMVLIALKAEQDLASRLRTYLQFSDLSTDNFELWRKWQSKAVNWGLANITGYGREYWTCSLDEGGSYNAGDCPHVFEQDDKDQAWPNVWWKLVDHDGFQTLVNTTLGLDIDNLIMGQIDVSQPIVNCVNTGGAGTRREITEPSPLWSWKNLTYWEATADEFVDDGTGRIKHISAPSSGIIRRQDVFDGPDPYDPDPGCKSTWHNIYQVNATAMFPNPSDTLNTWIQTHEAAATTASIWTTNDDIPVTSLISLLEYILTSVSVGNGSVQNIENYLQQVEFDKQLQAQFDAYQAANSGLHMFLDIFLTLIGLIPGIGDGGLLIEGIVRGASAISDALKIGRVVEATEDATDFGRIISVGVESAEEATAAGRQIDTLLDDASRATRGKLGQKFEKCNDEITSCNNYVDWIMNAGDLATALVPDDGSAAARRRSWEPSPAPASDAPTGFDEFLSPDRLFDSEPVVADLFFNTSTARLRSKRALPDYPEPCIWTIKSAEKLKGFSYDKKCLASTTLMWWNTRSDGTGVWKQNTFADCKKLISDKEGCQCDHILEAIEVKNALLSDDLVDDQAGREALCKAFPDLTEKIRIALNDANNMDGLWKEANTLKTNLVQTKQLQDLYHVSTSMLNDASKAKQIDVTRQYLIDMATRRQQVAQAIDKVLTDADTNFSGTKPAEWVKLYKAGMIDAERAKGDKSFAEKMDHSATLDIEATLMEPGERPKVKKPKKCKP